MRGVKTKSGNRWKRALTLCLLLLLLGLFGHSVKNVYMKKRGAESALAKMQSEKKVLEERKEFLEQSINRLSTEEGVEFEIRRKLNMAEAGESVAFILEGETPSFSPVPEKSNWQKLKDFFSDIFD